MTKQDSTKPSSNTLKHLTNELAKFAEARDWQQFHSPKNLAMALSAEAGELSEIFQWLTEAESKHLTEQQCSAVKDELADVLIYLCYLANATGIDLEQAVLDKLVRNQKRFPPAARP